MILYFDTSAVIKRYVDEPQAEEVRYVYLQVRAVCTHLITYAETLAGLAKAMRMGRLASERLPVLVEQVDKDWTNLEVVAPEVTLIRRAGHLALRYPLRGFDAVHLAAAERVFTSVARLSNFQLVGFDTHMRDAATALGITIYPSQIVVPA